MLFCFCLPLQCVPGRMRKAECSSAGDECSQRSCLLGSPRQRETQNGRDSTTKLSKEEEESKNKKFAISFLPETTRRERQAAQLSPGFCWKRMRCVPRLSRGIASAIPPRGSHGHPPVRRWRRPWSAHGGVGGLAGKRRSARARARHPHRALPSHTRARAPRRRPPHQCGRRPFVFKAPFRGNRVENAT